MSNALLSLRQQIESLDPSRHLGQRRGLFRRAPFGNQVGEYFRKYQSSQTQIEAIVNGLYRGQDELLRDNAALEQEKAHLWEMKKRLEQYAYMAAQLDEALTRKIAEIEAHDPEKARALQEDALFYVRQKRQDLLTQLAVTVQGYLALDLIRKNNAELIKGVERATTTTVSALRTAVIAALALGNQRLVLDQISALNIDDRQHHRVDLADAPPADRRDPEPGRQLHGQRREAPGGVQQHLRDHRHDRHVQAGRP